MIKTVKEILKKCHKARATNVIVLDILPESAAVVVMVEITDVVDVMVVAGVAGAVRSATNATNTDIMHVCVTRRMKDAIVAMEPVTFHVIAISQLMNQAVTTVIKPVI